MRMVVLGLGPMNKSARSAVYSTSLGVVTGTIVVLLVLHRFPLVRLPGLQVSIAVLAPLSTLALAIATFLIVYENHLLRRESHTPNLTIILANGPGRRLINAIQAPHGTAILIENAGPGLALGVRWRVSYVEIADWYAANRPRHFSKLNTLPTWPLEVGERHMMPPGPIGRKILYSDDLTKKDASFDSLLIAGQCLLRIDLSCNDSRGASQPLLSYFLIDNNGPSNQASRSSDWESLDWSGAGQLRLV